MQLSLSNRTYKDGTIAIPKGIENKIIQHKHYRAFSLFIQIKTLYVSGVILNDAGNYPYTQIAAYLGISVSGLRGKVRQLKKYKLLRTDRDKNIHLASYKTFVSLFRPQFLRRMRKYTYKNIASADVLIRTAAIQENFRKQEYTLKNKIIQKEIYGTVNAPVDRIKQPEGFLSILPIQSADCRKGEQRTDVSKLTIHPKTKYYEEIREEKRIKRHNNKHERRMRKDILQNYDNVLHKYKAIYLEQMEQVEEGFPDINPYITLSCAGIGRLFGVNATAGHYHRQKLIKAGLVSIIDKGCAHKICPVTTDGIEELRRQGGNVFSYNYPVKRGNRGREDKFFIHLPDRLALNFDLIHGNPEFADESKKFRSIIDDVLKKHETKN